MLFRLSTLNRHSTCRAGNQHRNRRRLLRIEGLEDRCLLSGTSAITEFTLPTPPAYALGAITTGPDGNLWFTESGFGTYDVAAIGMMNTTTHAVSSYALSSALASPDAIVTGPDGNLWFTESEANKIGMINPTTHAITEFALPKVKGAEDNSAFPRGITVGSDGNLWFSEEFGNEVGEINPTTHAITEYPLPSTLGNGWDITAGPDGNLWFTTRASTTGTGYICSISPITHAISAVAIPADPSFMWITSGSNGNLWFTQESTEAIGEINPTTDAITDFTIPLPQPSATTITSGPDGNLWFTELGGAAGMIGMINPTTDAITDYPIPYSTPEPVGITTGPDGNVWFTDMRAGTGAAIGVATLATSQLVVTQQPPASLTAGTPFGLTVEAEDSSGNLISSFNGTVTVALANPFGWPLGGTLTAAASDGVATFSGLTINTVYSGFTLYVSGGGLGWGVTSPLSVTPAAPSQVAITAQPPSGVTAGSGFGLQASIEDAYGNVETGDTASVTLALANNPTGATLGGTLSATASNGVSTFSELTLTKAAAGYTLQASSSGLSSATTSATTVTPAAATQVAITEQPPASIVVTASFGLIAAIEDEYGNVVTSASNTVKVALANNPAGAKLGGTLSEAASNGVVTFTGLTLNKVGSGYTLALSNSKLTSATSSAINVTSAPAMMVAAAATAPASAPNLLLAPLVLDSPGFLESLGLKKRPH